MSGLPAASARGAAGCSFDFSSAAETLRQLRLLSAWEVTPGGAKSERGAGEAGTCRERSRRHDGGAAEESARLRSLCQEDAGPYLHPELHGPLV